MGNRTDRHNYVWLRKRTTGKGVVYDVRWRSPTTYKMKSMSCGSSKRKAEIAAAKKEDELGHGLGDELRKTTWDKFTTEQLESVPGARHRSMCEYVLNEFNAICSPKTPFSVDHCMVERYVALLRDRKNSATTINTKIRYLRLCLNQAKSRGYLMANPAANWKPETANKPEPREITEAEQDGLIKAAKHYGAGWQLFIRAGIETGARRGELLKLRWQHVDFNGKSIIFVMTKGKKDRRVPVQKRLIDDFRVHQVKTLVDGGPFVAMAQNVYRTWRLIRKKAKLPDLKIHDMRRTFASRMLRDGVPIKTVQELTGHANVETLLRYYTHVSFDDKVQAIQRMAEKYG